MHDMILLEYNMTSYVRLPAFRQLRELLLGLFLPIHADASVRRLVAELQRVLEGLNASASTLFLANYIYIYYYVKLLKLVLAFITLTYSTMQSY